MQYVPGFLWPLLTKNTSRDITSEQQLCQKKATELFVLNLEVLVAASIILGDLVLTNTYTERKEKNEKNIETDFNIFTDFYYGFISGSGASWSTRVFWR